MTRARTAAILALVLLAVGALGAVYDVIDDFPVAVLLLVAFGLALWAGWAGLLRTGAARVAGLGVAGALLAVVVVTIAVEGVTLGDVLVLGCLAAAVAAARVAFIVHIPLARVAPTARPVLFVNPRSGGGKAERFRLVDEARDRGIEPIELGPRRRPARSSSREAIERRRRRAGDGGRRRLAGDRRRDRRRARPALRLHPGRHPQPLRPRPRGRPRRRGRRPRRLRRRRRAPRRPGRGQRPGVRQQRLARGVRRGRAARGLPRREAADAARHDARRRSAPSGERPRPALARGRAATSTRGGAAVLVSNNRYRLGRAIGSGTRPADRRRPARDHRARRPARPRREQPRPAAPVARVVGARRSRSTPIGPGADRDRRRGRSCSTRRCASGSARACCACGSLAAHPGASPSANAPEGAVATACAELVRIALGGDRRNQPTKGEHRMDIYRDRARRRRSSREEAAAPPARPRGHAGAARTRSSSSATG